VTFYHRNRVRPKARTSSFTLNLLQHCVTQDPKANTLFMQGDFFMQGDCHLKGKFQGRDTTALCMCN